MLKQKQKRSVYEFGADEDTSDQADSPGAKKTDSIPLTNTIPSNQPVIEAFRLPISIYPTDLI